MHGLFKQLALATLATLITAGVASALPLRSRPPTIAAPRYIANDCSGRIEFKR